MGTRSITNVHSEGRKSPILVSIYQQYDGYFEGVGKELQDFLSGFTIVNGIGRNTPEKAANGMGCLAAQLVSHLKNGIGGTYIVPVGQEESYNYHIYLEKDELKLCGYGYDDEKKVFSLKPVEVK